jgi:hypothetical protein
VSVIDKPDPTVWPPPGLWVGPQVQSFFADRVNRSVRRFLRPRNVIDEGSTLRGSVLGICRSGRLLVWLAEPEDQAKARDITRSERSAMRARPG